MAPYTVGILGAGLVTQAVHIPSLARLDGRLVVSRVMDPDLELAARVAAPLSAEPTASVDDVLLDTTLDVLVICSPHSAHARQLIESVAASSRRVVLCEKPLTTSREDLTALGALTSSPARVVVGAMHMFDPVWRKSLSSWQETGARPRTIRSSLVLPPNAVFESVATEVQSPPRSAAQHSRSDAIGGAVLGLAVHDLPLIRRLAPVATPKVRHATWLEPYGYVIELDAGGVDVVLTGVVTEGEHPTWRLESHGPEASLEIEFPPSYVAAGSSTATLSRPGSRQHFSRDTSNGYLDEWRTIIRILDGVESAPPLTDLIDDMAFTLTVAEGALEAVAR